MMSDNTSARVMLPDGTYERQEPVGEPFNVQEFLYDTAYKAAGSRKSK